MALGTWDVFLRVLTLIVVLAVLVRLARWLLDLARSHRRPTGPEAKEHPRQPSTPPLRGR